MSDINLMAAPQQTGIRDAVHVAVVSLEASSLLYTGDRVQWDRKGISVKNYSHPGKAIGIVNPFAIEHYNPGKPVWIFLYPNTVTGMTHHWNHPDFDSEEISEFGLTKQSANAFVKSMADTLMVEPDYLLELATRYCQHQSGCWPHDDYQASSEDWEMFWKAYSTVTGNPRPTENRVPFRCAC